MTSEIDPGLVAADLRVVLGRLMRRLRAEHAFPLSHGAVLGRLDREGWLATTIARDLSPAEQGVLADAVELLERLADT